MKRFAASLLLLGAGFAAHAQQQTYTVIAKVANAVDSNVAHLLYYEESTPHYLTEKLKDGQYVFKGTAPFPARATFFMDDNGIGYAHGFPDKLALRLEEGTTTITVNGAVRDAKVKGGKYNKDMDQYRKFTAEVDKRAEFLNGTIVMGITNKMPKEQVDSFQKEMKTAVDAWIKRNQLYAKTYPKSYSSIEALSMSAGSHPDLTIMQPLFDALAPDLKETVAGSRLKQSLDAARNTSIGGMAPLFTQNDTLGNPISLKDFRGRYVLLDFWASWCGPCRAENPNYVRNYNKYHAKGFDMLGVSLDKEGDQEKWIAAIHKDGLMWPQVSDLKYWQNDVAKIYGIKSVPQNFLIDPQGKILAANLRGEELDKKLSEIFDKQ